MGKFNLSTAVKGFALSVRKYQPEILTGLGIAGMLIAGVMAVRATPKALDRMEEVKEAHMEDTDKKAFAKDVLTKVAPVYIPSVIVAGTSVACLIGSSSVSHKRNAALATAYTLSESALKEYQEKVVETVGEKKERAVRDAIAKDKIEQNPVSTKEVIITEKGNTLCYDILSGRYFKSDIDKLNRSVNDLNRRMRSENYISLNEFYGEIGLNEIGIGYELGWHINRGYIDLDFSSQLTEENEPCLTIAYRVAPQYDYDRL